MAENVFGRPGSDAAHTNLDVSNTLGQCSTKIRAQCVAAPTINGTNVTADSVVANTIDTGTLIVNNLPLNFPAFEEGVATAQAPWVFYSSSGGEIYRFGNLIIFPFQVQYTTTPSPVTPSPIAVIPPMFRPNQQIVWGGLTFFNPVTFGAGIGGAVITLDPNTGLIEGQTGLGLPGSLAGAVLNATLTWRA